MFFFFLFLVFCLKLFCRKIMNSFITAKMAHIFLQRNSVNLIWNRQKHVPDNFCTSLFNIIGHNLGRWIHEVTKVVMILKNYNLFSRLLIFTLQLFKNDNIHKYTCTFLNVHMYFSLENIYFPYMPQLKLWDELSQNLALLEAIYPLGFSSLTECLGSDIFLFN